MKHINGLWSDIGNWFRTMSGKRLALILIAAAIIIAPTVFATVGVFHHEYVKNDNYFSVSLYDSDGNEIARDSQLPENAARASLTEIFYELTKEPKPLKARPDGLDNSSYVKAAISYSGTSYEITCYFSNNSPEGYFVDSDGKHFTIPERLNTAFLTTPHGEIFYSSAKVFELTTIDRDVITPKSADWCYKAADGKYLSANKNKLTDKIKTYEITGALDIGFEKVPDSSSAHVYSDEKLIYTGTWEALSSLTVDTNDRLRVYIYAEWLDNEGADSYGKAVYEFYVKIKNRSTFTLSTTEVSAGSFAILECSNVTDVNKIDFTSSNGDFSPIFMQYNNLWRVIIPFAENYEADSFDFTVVYGASSESFSINVLPATDPKTYSSDTLYFENTDTPILLCDSVRKAILSTPLPENGAVYFRGNFADPEGLGYVAAYTHGGIMSWGEELENSYVTVGNEYVLKDGNANGSSVTALQNGEVAYVGRNEFLGNYVVIDHGCGLRTWYTGLGKIDAEVGDVLLTGQHLGKTAEGSFEGKEGFTLYCTVYDTVIDPNTLWK